MDQRQRIRFAYHHHRFPPFPSSDHLILLPCHRILSQSTGSKNPVSAQIPGVKSRNPCKYRVCRISRPTISAQVFFFHVMPDIIFFSVLCDISILDSLEWAVTYAGHAVGAGVLPYRTTVLHFDIVKWAKSCTFPAADTFFRGVKRL